MLRPIGTRVQQIEKHDGGEIEVVYVVGDHKLINAVAKAQGAIGNVEVGPIGVVVEILTILGAKYIIGPDAVEGEEVDITGDADAMAAQAQAEDQAEVIAEATTPVVAPVEEPAAQPATVEAPATEPAS